MISFVKFSLISISVLSFSFVMASELNEQKETPVSFYDGKYEYKLTHKKISGMGESGVLEVADAKTKELIYHEEGVPFKKACQGYENIFSGHVAILKHSSEEFKERYTVFCSTNGSKFSALSFFRSGQLVTKIQTVADPLLLKVSESGVMYFKITHKYPLIGGSEGTFYEIAKFDPWMVNRFRLMPVYDDIAIQEYKKIFLEMAAAVKANVDYQRFYLNPMLSMLTSIGDTNYICNEIKGGALSFAAESQINEAIRSNSENGYPYFNAGVCIK